MPSKQPLYTALGFVTWTVGKRVVKRKVTGGDKRGRRVRKLLLAVVVLGGAGAGAYAVTSSSSSSPSM